MNDETGAVSRQPSGEELRREFGTRRDDANDFARELDFSIRVFPVGDSVHSLRFEFRKFGLSVVATNVAASCVFSPSLHYRDLLLVLSLPSLRS